MVNEFSMRWDINQVTYTGGEDVSVVVIRESIDSGGVVLTNPERRPDLRKLL